MWRDLQAHPQPGLPASPSPSLRPRWDHGMKFPPKGVRVQGFCLRGFRADQRSFVCSCGLEARGRESRGGAGAEVSSRIWGLVGKAAGPAAFRVGGLCHEHSPF